MQPLDYRSPTTSEPGTADRTIVSPDARAEGCFPASFAAILGLLGGALRLMARIAARPWTTATADVLASLCLVAACGAALISARRPRGLLAATMALVGLGVVIAWAVATTFVRDH